MQNIYTPYTYLIGWSSLNKWYYGARYAKNCHPSDLFTKYFTSSKYVKSYIQKYGRPDIIQIRKTFNNKQSTILWEKKILKKLKVVENTKWLNQTYNEGPGNNYPNPIPGGEAFRIKYTGLTFDQRFGKKKQIKSKLNKKFLVKMFGKIRN